MHPLLFISPLVSFYASIIFYLSIRCFRHDSVEDILTALQQDGSEWATKQLQVSKTLLINKLQIKISPSLKHNTPFILILQFITIYNVIVNL